MPGSSVIMMPIRSLCIAEDLDRPTVATFIGMRDAGIDISVVCPANHPNQPALIAAGVPMIEIPLAKYFGREGIAALRTELIRGDYHIMHTFSNRGISNGLRACRGLPIKVICYRGIVGAVGFLDPMSWLRHLNPRIDRIICVCDAIRRYFMEMRPAFLRMPGSRPVTIYKGHKLEWYTQQPADLTELGIPADAFVVTCTASYRPRKGIEFLIDALAHLPDDVHLMLVGSMDSSKLEQHIQQSPARDRIHRVGFHKNAPALSAASDVFCMPSTKREGLARAIIEAMAYQVPPVVTDAGGSPELVVDGESGFVVPPRDSKALATAIRTLYDDPELRRKMGAAARQRIGKDFRNEDTIAQTIALYRELVPDPDAPRDWPSSQ
ncbi:MAG: glycosyltransferase family 4 protein [Woeseiaceae bacterium]